MLLLGLALVVAAALGVALLELLLRRADVAAALVFGSVVVQAYFIDRVPALALPGGVQVYLTDMVASLILGAAVLRLLRTPRFDRFQRWLLVLGVLLLVSLVRGVAAFGLQPSIADFREYLFFGGVALYFATFPPAVGLYDRIGRIWLAMTIPMMLLVCARWLAVFAGVDLGVPAEKYGADAAIRVIDGPFNFFLAHAFVLSVPVWLRGQQERWIRWTSVLLLLFCLVLNRRTVWLAIVVGVAVLMLRDRRLGRRALVLVALGGVLTAVAFVWLGGLQESSEPVVQSGSGNLSWRVQGWSELVTAWSRSPTEWAIGQPVGSGFARQVEGVQTNTQYGPHNFYIEILVRTGFVGLVALVVLTVGLLRALWHTPSRDTGLLGPGVLPALLAMQIVWYLTWPPGSEQGLVTGLAAAVAAAEVSRRRLAARPVPATADRALAQTGNGRR
ncbi:MAG TPA: O-antigen ligase family protein [Actinomycetota bacterium]|nr:O-antigen ligase family protein [Actinomycetota bacterium]